MKVKQLISKLEKLDPDLIVLVNGYEGGYSDIDAEHYSYEPSAFVPTVFVKNFNEESYYGSHAIEKHYHESSLERFTGIVLPRC